MIVHPQSIRGSLTRTADGYRARRMYRVSEVPPGADGFSQVLRNTALPQVGEQYSAALPNLRVESVNIKLAREESDHTVYDAEVSYSTETADETGSSLSLSDPIEVSLRPYLGGISSFYDKDGNLNRRTFRRGSGFLGSGTTQTFEIEIQKPGIAVSVTATTRVHPDTLNQQYLGTVNARQWANNPPRTMRCDGFSAQFGGKDRLYRVTGDFVRAATESGTWEARNKIIVGGIVPEGAKLGNGIWDIKVYPESAWRTLSGFKYR